MCGVRCAVCSVQCAVCSVQCAVASVVHEVFGSGISFGFCALAGRQRKGENGELRSGLSFCGAKKQRACTRNLMQALDLFGARTRNRTGTPLRAGDFKSRVWRSQEL